MTGHSLSQPKVEPVRRIGIVWEQGAYYVSTPNWNGGEVVLASDYDNLRAKVDELTAALREISDLYVNAPGWAAPTLERRNPRRRESSK